MKKILLSAAVTGACMFGIAGQASADGHCGSLTMAEMNWASAELMANVDKIILEEGYGCEVELVAACHLLGETEGVVLFHDARGENVE